jgi:hypothetical protein
MNEGAILQTLGGLRLLEDYMQCHVELIDYRSPKKIFATFRLIAIQGIFTKSPLEAYTRYIHLKRSIKILFTKYLSKKRMIGDDYDKTIDWMNSLAYDTVFVGSDMVWLFDPLQKNKMLSPPWPNPYWLSPKLNAKKVSLSACTFNTVDDPITVEQKTKIANILGSYDVISARDELTVNFVKNLADKNAVRTPDPAFYLQLPKTNIEKKVESFGIDLSKPIMVILLWNERISKLARELCEKRGYQLVALEDFNRYAHFSLAGKLDVLEWAEFFRLASFCLTGRFHGAVFALKNGIPILTIDKNMKPNSKISSLIADMEIPDSYTRPENISTSIDLEKKIDRVISHWDKKTIFSKVDEQRNKLIEFIESVKRIIG